MTTAAEVQSIYANIIRQSLNSIVASATAAAIDGGSTTKAGYIASLINQAANSTRPALLVSNYITGIAPDSATLDNRTTFCQNQYNAYVAAGSANANLGPYEALGVAFADDASFAAKVSGKSLSTIINETYTAALGAAPGSAQVTHFTSQYTYYYNLYVGAGLTSAAADNRAKAAVVGQILGYGGTNLSTTFSTKATTWLTNAGNGSPAYSTAL